MHRRKSNRTTSQSGNTWTKAPEDRRSPKPGGCFEHPLKTPKVLDCACPLALLSELAAGSAVGSPHVPTSGSVAGRCAPSSGSYEVLTYLRVVASMTTVGPLA